MHVRNMKDRGFSLVELTVVVAFLGVLLGIAVPLFIDYIKASKRADGVGVLVEAAQFMERNYSKSARYNEDENGTAIALPPGVSTAPRGSSGSYYTISFAEAATETAFKIQAVPVNSMSGDDCGTFFLTHLGERSVSGTKPLNECWRN